MKTANISLLYTQKYFDAVQPLLVVLQNRKKEVTVGIWLTIVNHQKEEVIYNPNRYLGTELSLRDEMIESVENIFHDFLKRELLFKP